MKWKERYEEFAKDPIKVYRKKIEHSRRLIERYKELIEKHQKKIERLKKLIELAESGKLKRPENLEGASKKYVDGIKAFLGLKEVNSCVEYMEETCEKT